MKRAFWQYVHDRLENMWHWTYRTKLARPIPTCAPVTLTYTYFNSKTGQKLPVTPVAPITF